MICKARTQSLSQQGHQGQLRFSNLVHGWEECHTNSLIGASISGYATKMLHGQKAGSEAIDQILIQASPLPSF